MTSRQVHQLTAAVIVGALMAVGTFLGLWVGSGGPLYHPQPGQKHVPVVCDR